MAADLKKTINCFILLLCILPFFLSALLNKGFLASDEYWTSIIHYIPAQTHSVWTLVAADDVKAPTQNWPMHAFAQLSLFMGETHPFAQYSTVVLLCGLLNLSLLFLALTTWRRWRGLSIYFLVGFTLFVASPLVFTRPMFEVMAAPWVLWSALLAWRYEQTPRLRWLIVGSTLMGVAFCLRPQVGICARSFVLLPILHRRGRDRFGLCLWGGFLFFIAGVPDWILRGQWHYSLRALITYNMEHGADYGRQPFWYYLPHVFVLSLAPWWIGQIGKSKFYAELKSLRVIWLMLAMFIFEHMLFAQKFDRFLIPVLALFYLLAWDLLAVTSIWKKCNFRSVSLVLIMLIFWIAAVFSVPQQNLLQISQFLDQHKEVETIWSYDESLTWVPDVLTTRPELIIKEYRSTPAEFQSEPCPKYILVRASQQSEAAETLKNFAPIAIFSTGIIDQMAYKMNREHNIRRAPATLYTCK